MIMNEFDEQSCDECDYGSEEFCLQIYQYSEGDSVFAHTDVSPVVTRRR